jgi:hypothetical protein
MSSGRSRDGWFLFSSHNELWHSRASQPLAWRVLGQMRDSLRYLRHLKSLRPVRNLREGFSYRYERVFGNTQTLLVYYVSPAAQVRQLRSVGFACEAMFNTEGDELRPDMHEARPSAWLYYLARKADASS